MLIVAFKDCRIGIPVGLQFRTMATPSTYGDCRRELGLNVHVTVHYRHSWLFADESAYHNAKHKNSLIVLLRLLSVSVWQSASGRRSSFTRHIQSTLHLTLSLAVTAGTPLKTVDKSCYLVSTISLAVNLDEEVSSRLPASEEQRIAMLASTQLLEAASCTSFCRPAAVCERCQRVWLILLHIDAIAAC